jgi:hypothetical protein
MAHTIPVIASIHGRPRRHCARTIGFVLKYLIVVLVGICLANVVSTLVVSKTHGFIIAALAFLFSLQEAMFFAVRAKVGDPLQSKAVGIRELDEMLNKTVRLKDYLDRLWFVALPLKVMALAGGVLLSNEGMAGVIFAGTRVEMNKISAIAMISWIVLAAGAELTLRTFLTLRHVDRFMLYLQVEARKIEAANEAVKAIEAAQPEARSDPALDKYERPSVPTKAVDPSCGGAPEGRRRRSR